MNSSAMLNISEGNGEERVTPPILHHKQFLPCTRIAGFLRGHNSLLHGNHHENQKSRRDAGATKNEARLRERRLPGLERAQHAALLRVEENDQGAFKLANNEK
jgi:hypothetical protein